MCFSMVKLLSLTEEIRKVWLKLLPSSFYLYRLAEHTYARKHNKDTYWYIEWAFWWKTTDEIFTSENAGFEFFAVCSWYYGNDSKSTWVVTCKNSKTYVETHKLSSYHFLPIRDLWPLSYQDKHVFSAIFWYIFQRSFLFLYQKVTLCSLTVEFQAMPTSTLWEA